MSNDADVHASETAPTLRLPTNRAPLEAAAAVLLVVVAAATFALVVLLAVVHVNDRYDVGAASGSWMGLAAAARHGVWYPPVFANGFYGGTRYMPLPILLQAGASFAAANLLLSAKLIIYAIGAWLFGLLYVVARRRGAPVAVAIAIVAAILASSAAATTTLGIRWDSLATVLQLLALVLVSERPTQRRAALSGALCGLALLTKISALWAPAAIVVWLVLRNRRGLLSFAASLGASVLALGGLFELLSRGRFLDNLRAFTFAGSQFSSNTEGFHRLYQLALRNQRALPLFLALAVGGLVLAIARRRFGVYELALVFLLPILVVVMRDFGAYENHLLDLEVLSGLVVAGMWPAGRAPTGRAVALQALIVGCLVLATIEALRFTYIPDARAAFSHELRGRADPRYRKQPFGDLRHTCALFEDATLPILAGQRPVVVDAFIVHRLQTRDPRTLALLARRIEQRQFKLIVLGTPLTNLGWFATLDFGTTLAEAMRANYRLTRTTPADGLLVYTPKSSPKQGANGCAVRSLSNWQ